MPSGRALTAAMGSNLALSADRRPVGGRRAGDGRGLAGSPAAVRLAGGGRRGGAGSRRAAGGPGLGDGSKAAEIRELVPHDGR